MSKLRLQPANHLVGGHIALIAGLQCDKKTRVVLGLAATGAKTDADRSHSRILRHDVSERADVAHHLGEGNILRPFRGADDEAGILLRKEAFWYRHEEIPCGQQRRDEYGERGSVMAQREIESPAISREEAIETALRQYIEPAMLHISFAAHEARAHH